MKNELEILRVYYQKDIDKIAEYDIWEKLIVRNLNLSRKGLQAAYKYKNDYNFRGNIIDYICFICMNEFSAYAFMAYFNTNSIKKTLTFLEIYLELHLDLDNLICRLILKDKTYLYESFNIFRNVHGEDIFDKIKEMLYKRTNKKLCFKPIKDNNSAKLTSG